MVGLGTITHTPLSIWFWRVLTFGIMVVFYVTKITKDKKGNPKIGYKQNQMHLIIFQMNNITKLKGEIIRNNPCNFQHSILTT